ncbi:MAG: ABC transporter ATP-binding protein [Paenibacillus sp.]|uniref:ABC-2 type transport system ATP-binding protein n=1 Tax=Paenibacillus aquistagni TaxID=1852522 RepID=A0A1X7L831_9BACL|nr:ABC transporter ATP-binding protein [Paenibacillus aquistagni]MBR2569490.1 ABC transporter ATP-binding protein [Paenibacillus sp.]SMG49717.1 ABC-2 type transport system ATP-binding protein [Paenibacillus aquistagni]
MAIAIQGKQVVKRYGGAAAVDHMDFTFEQGKITALLGPNGAGKTTAISMILGLVRPTSGEIAVLGEPAGTASLRQRVGAMMQDVKAPDGLRVAELLQLFRSYYANPLSLEQLLDIAGLHKEAKKRATSLSGGQRRRLAFAQCLAGNPELILLDEPTVAMDVEARERFWDTIRALAAKGRTIILTTHDLSEADAVADHIIMMAAGKVVAEGTPQELKAKSALRTITFRTNRMVVDEQFMSIPGVNKVERVGERVRLHVHHPDHVLTVLVQSEWGASDIEVTQAKLEDAFRALTGHKRG